MRIFVKTIILTFSVKFCKTIYSLVLSTRFSLRSQANPSCPTLFHPQVYRSPQFVTAAECHPPALISITNNPSRNTNNSGFSVKISDPFPS